MTINFNNQVVLTEVLGHRTHHSCKQVVNKTTGKVYASATDAAEALGSNVGNVSQCCLGIIKTVKGNELEYLDHTSGNINSLAKVIRAKQDRITELEAQIAKLEADAAVGRTIREAKEAEAKAKETARTTYDKAVARYERRKKMVERKDAELQALVARLMAAETEMNEAWEILMKFEGKCE